MTEINAYTIKQFCESHNLPQSTYFKLQKEGKGPRVRKAGKRVLISIESAKEWRNETDIEIKS